jgi:Zn finger protein HypA/HybF involved in hydrogenase expression
MHEAGIAERILEAALAAAANAGGARLSAVEVEAGPEAAISEEALRFHWAHATAGTNAERVALRIVPVEEPAALRLVAIDVDEPEHSLGGGR